MFLSDISTPTFQFTILRSSHPSKNTTNILKITFHSNPSNLPFKKSDKSQGLYPRPF